jgi:acetyl-CoA carboxylase carboxyl transferase subunit beta
MIRPDATSEAELWTRCPECAELVNRRKLERKLFVCPRCGYHFRLTADQRLALLIDRGSFVEHDAGLGSRDILDFPDEPPYEQRLAEVAARTGHPEAVLTGMARIDGIMIALGVFNFVFMGGSMGSAVGEKLTRIIEHALAERLPLVIVSASGGARMQEGIYSLMQMAKLTAALGRLRAAGLPYVSVLTDPTTGGVAASVALLGDVNVAEPRALIGFAGPRVIAETLNEQLPADFQRSEFLMRHGMLDAVVERAELKQTLARLLRLLDTRGTGRARDVEAHPRVEGHAPPAGQASDGVDRVGRRSRRTPPRRHDGA